MPPMTEPLVSMPEPSVVLPSVTVTVPVGGPLAPLTVMARFTLVPRAVAVAGLGVTVMVVAFRTICVSEADELDAKLTLGARSL